MNNYNSQTTAHVGYIIALTVGIAAILYQIKITEFFKRNVWIRMAFYVPLSALFGAIVFCILRIIFWAWMSSEVLTVTSDQAQAVGATTVIYGIQQYLVNLFMKNPGLSSLFYSWDLKIHFGFSLFLLSAITFGVLLLFDGFYLCDKKKGWKRYFFGSALILTIIIIAVIAIFSSFVEPMNTTKLFRLHKLPFVILFQRFVICRPNFNVIFKYSIYGDK